MVSHTSNPPHRCVAHVLSAHLLCRGKTIYIILYIYICAQRLGFAQALQRRGFPFPSWWWWWRRWWWWCVACRHCGSGQSPGICRIYIYIHIQMAEVLNIQLCKVFVVFPFNLLPFFSETLEIPPLVQRSHCPQPGAPSNDSDLGVLLAEESLICLWWVGSRTGVSKQMRRSVLQPLDANAQNDGNTPKKCYRTP